MEEDPQVAGQVGGTGMHPRVRMPLAVVEAIQAIGGMTTDVLDPGRLVVGEVHEWRAVREEAVWVGRCRAPAGVQACRRAVRRLRYLVTEHREGGGAELEFNAGSGDYLQLGCVGFANNMVGVEVTHTLTGGTLIRCAAGDKVLSTGAGRGMLSLWINQNEDLDLALTGQLYLHLVQAHMRLLDFVNACPGQGEASARLLLVLRQVSLFRYAAEFMGLGEADVYCALALLLRGATTWLPAHTDPDLPHMVPHYYMAGERKREGVPARGMSLFVAGDRGTAGKEATVVEVCTDAPPGEMYVVGFKPAKQLHWVEDRGSPGARLDRTGLRGIPFNNNWLGQQLCKQAEKGVPVLIRMAPIRPKSRTPISCTVCLNEYGDPAVQPQAWLQHFGACVQAANGKPYVCLACCTT
jgi:hypothetical protein